MGNCIIVNPKAALVRRFDGTAVILEIADGALVEVRQGTYEDYQRTGSAPDQSWVAGGTAAARVTTPAKPGYASEILQMVPHGSVDKFGNLLNPDGSVHTLPDQHEPLRAAYASEQELLDDVARVNYPYKVKIDGRLLPYTQYGQDPVAWYVADPVTGRITHPYAIPTPPPVVTLPPPVVGTGDIDVDVAWPASGQVRPRTNSFGTGTARFHITVPASLPGLNPAHLGSIGIDQVSGSAVMARRVLITKADGTVLYDQTGDGIYIPYTVNNAAGSTAAGGQFDVGLGESFTVAVTNGVNATAQGSDFLFDLATPDRY